MKKTNMKDLGIILIIGGVIWALIAFNMKTTVTTQSQSFGSGAYAIEIPSVTVNNIGLMDRRRNNLIFAGLTILVGAMFIGFSSNKSTAQKAERVKCPYCAELVKTEAVVCKHCGKNIEDEIANAKKNAHRETILKLCSRLEEGKLKLNLNQYKKIAHYVDVSLTVNVKIFRPKEYVINNGESEVRFKRFRELRPWFLENVVPRIENED